MKGKWSVVVTKAGHIYVENPNEFFLIMDSIVEQHTADSKEEAEALKAKLEQYGRK